MATRTEEDLEKDIYLIEGGLHLLGKSSAEILDVVRKLGELGIKKVAPSHWHSLGIRLSRPKLIGLSSIHPMEPPNEIIENCFERMA
jgi:hypothetical protein